MYTIARKWDVKKGEENPELRVVFFDIPRSQTNVSYRAIEQVKNGVITSTKYESQTLILTIPHVVIFANWPPKREMLSEDRWDIRVLGAGDRTEPTDQGDPCN